MKILKRVLSLLLCPAMLTLCACAGPGSNNTNETTTVPEETIDPNAPLCDGKTLKILAITSSFGLNTTQVLYDVATAHGFTDVVVARLYGSGATLQQHAENAKTNAAFYEYTKNNSGKWDTMNPVTMLYGLQDEEWDIIFMQQSAAHSPQPQTYGDYIDQIVPYVKENIKNPNAKFVWNMTWAYQQDNNDEYVFHKFDNDQMKMYEGIVTTLKDLIVPRTDFYAIIPSGTAIQNARTSYFGDTLTRDGLHLNSLGRLISAYTLFATITKQPLTEIKLNEVTKVMSPETQPIVLTDADKQVVIEAVNAAIANPYSVTQSQYTN